MPPPEGYALSADDLIAQMDEAGIPRAVVLSIAYQSDTPRGAGGLMSWAASKAVGYGSRRRALRAFVKAQNCPPAPSASSCSRMYLRTCSSSNPTVETA